MDIPEVAGEPVGADPEAPWGRRPDGRPYRHSPEERERLGQQLKDARAAANERKRAEREGQRQGEPVQGPTPDAGDAKPVDRTQGDRAPGAARGARRGRLRDRGRTRAGKPAPEPVEVPPFRQGPIAKGMNGVYRKVGRIVKAVNPAFGAGIIACTEKDSPDDITVGEAWEELARVSPTWRVRLLKLTTGGVYGQLFWAHLPMLLALLMLEPVARRVPFARAASAFLGDGQGDVAGSAPGFPTGAELGEMMAMAQGLMGPLLAQRAGANPDRTVVDAPTLLMPTVDSGEAA